MWENFTPVQDCEPRHCHPKDYQPKFRFELRIGESALFTSGDLEMLFLLVFRRYAPFASFGLGFEGDTRTSPSISLAATARTTGCLIFDQKRAGHSLSFSSGSSYVGFGSTFAGFAGRHFSNVRFTVSDIKTTALGISFVALTEGSNPMIPGAPDIDTYVDLSAKWMGDMLHFEGRLRGDSFPNAEVFVMDGADHVCLLFDGRTGGGRNTGPFTRLLGAGESNFLGSFSKAVPLSPMGNFVASQTTCPMTKM